MELPQITPNGKILDKGRKFERKLVVTNSLKNTLLDCQAKFYWEYERRLSPNVTADYFVWGGFLHVGIELRLKGGSDEETQEKLRAKVEKVAAQRPIPPKVLNQYEGYILLIPQVLDAYMLRYKDEIGLYEVIESEKEFSLPLRVDGDDAFNGYGWVFEGRIDTAIRNTQTGVCYVHDTKTPGSQSAAMWQRLPLDGQLKGYLLGLQRAVGVHTTFAVYDVIQKPPEQKKMACDDPQEWADAVGAKYLINNHKLFQKKIQEYPQETIDDYYHQLCHFAKQVEFHRQEGIWLMHHPGNRIGGCPYYDLCVYGENSNTLSAFYERSVDEYNKELSDESD